MSVVDIPNAWRAEARAAIDTATDTAYGYVLGTLERDSLINALYPVIEQQVRAQAAGELIIEADCMCEREARTGSRSQYEAMAIYEHAARIVLGGHSMSDLFRARIEPRADGSWHIYLIQLSLAGHVMRDSAQIETKFAVQADAYSWTERRAQKKASRMLKNVREAVANLERKSTEVSE